MFLSIAQTDKQQTTVPVNIILSISMTAFQLLEAKENFHITAFFTYLILQYCAASEKKIVVTVTETK